MRLAELKKLSMDTTIMKKMDELGFSKGPSSFWFYRNRGEYIDVLAFVMYSSGSFFQVAVVCFKKQLIDHCDMRKFPTGFIKQMPFLSELYISKRKGLDPATAWPSKTEEAALSSVEQILDIIETAAEPWYQRITSDKSFYESLAPGLRNAPYGKKLAAKLTLN